MKFVFYFFLILYSCYFSVFAQSNLAKVVKGSITDSVTKVGVEFTTILIKTTGGQTAGFSNEQGFFELSITNSQIESIRFQRVGYKTKTILDTSNFKFNADTLNLGEIVLDPALNLLTEVQIKEKPLLLKREGSKLVYLVTNDPDVKTSNMLDIMPKVPLLSLDQNNNVQYKGGENFRILLNGRQTAVFSQSLNQALASIGADKIVRVEVLMEVPARYLNQNITGLINIVTKDQGINGISNTISGNINTLSGYGINNSLIFKNRKLALTHTLGWNELPISNSSQISVTNGINDSFRSENSDNIKNRGNGTRSSLNLSYNLDSLSLFLMSLSFSDNNKSQGIKNKQSFRDANSVNSFISTTDFSTFSQALSWKLTYERNFRKKRSNVFVLQYAGGTTNNNFDNQTSYTNQVSYQFDDNKQINNQKINFHTLQADISSRLGKTEIENGLTGIFNQSNSEKSFFLVTGNSPQPTPQFVDVFEYRQNIVRYYASAFRAINKWTIRITGTQDFERTNSIFPLTPNQNNIQKLQKTNATFNISRGIGDFAGLNLFYSNGISRATFEQLNGFTNTTNQLYIIRGNPSLLPETFQNISLDFQSFKKGFINFGPSIRFTKNKIEPIAINSGDTTIISLKNIPSTVSYIFNLGINYRISSKITADIKGFATLTDYKQINTINRVNFQFFSFLSYRVNAQYSTNLLAIINLPNYINQGIIRQSSQLNISASGSFFNRKLGCSLSFESPFRKNKTATSDINDVNFNQLITRSEQIRIVRFGLSYRMGSLNNTRMRAGSKDLRKQEEKIINENEKLN